MNENRLVTVETVWMRNHLLPWGCGMWLRGRRSLAVSWSYEIISSKNKHYYYYIYTQRTLILSKILYSMFFSPVSNTHTHTMLMYVYLVYLICTIDINCLPPVKIACHLPWTLYIYCTVREFMLCLSPTSLSPIPPLIGQKSWSTPHTHYPTGNEIFYFWDKYSSDVSDHRSVILDLS